MAIIRIVTTRAPGLIPSLVKEIDHATNPVVLIPESFTLACETEIVNRSRDKGFFDLKIFSPSSLVREVRELTGHGSKKPVSADGQNMIVSQVLHHHQDELKYYRDSVAQPTLAQKIAGQINDFHRARLTPGFLRDFDPSSRRTKAKMEDMALVWDGYNQVLGEKYEDNVGQWLSAIDHIRRSGLIRNAQLLIYGFDYITHDILNLVQAAVSEDGAAEVVIGLISDDVGPDREIFRAANDSVLALADYLNHNNYAFTLQRETMLPPIDPGIAYVEKSIYANGAFASEKIYQRKDEEIVIRPAPAAAKKQAMADLNRTEIPDMSHVRVYYAKNSYLECQHACQTLIDWHRDGIPWEDMAIAVCEQNTLPSLLPLTLSASGIPFNAKQDQPILMSGYAQYFLSLLRILRLNFCQNDVLRMIKTGFTALSSTDIMDMENYARKNGIHRGRWLKPFYMPEKAAEKEKAEHMEALRQQLIDPIVELKAQLSQKGCTGKQAATLLFDFITSAGIYERLLAQEDILAAQGDDLGIDRNRQVWTAINELLDSLAVFIADEPLPLHDLCTMLEASMASRMIKSLPQLSRAVMVAPPQMFFSSGVRCMIVMGLQESELSTSGGILSEQERSQLEQFIEDANREYYKQQNTGGMVAMDEAEELSESESSEVRPFSKIGQSLLDLAARQKQDVYQAVSLAREQLMISCSSAKPSGGVLTPATAFKRLSKVVSDMNPSNVSGGLMNTDIRPFAPAFALEALAVKLRDTKDSKDGFLHGTGTEDILWQNALGSLYRSETWHEKTAGVLNGLHVAVTTTGITPDQASRLYQSRGMTISRVETFGSCPWRHLLQYGLDLFPTATYVFERNEQGTFNHDVIKMFLDEAMKLPEWPDITEHQQNVLLNRILRERVRQWEGGILRSDIVHRYQGVSIIHGVRTSIASLMRSFQQKPHFLPMAAEVPFGMPDTRSPINLPPISIKTADGAAIAFSGRIDRIDRLELPDGRTYFMIVDNKMSSRDVKQNSIVAGLQLQLPLYIRAAQNGLAGYQAAGGLYQPIKDVLVDGDDAGKIIAQIDKDLQTSGIILDDKGIQDAMKPVKIARKSDTNDTISAVTPEELESVLDCAQNVVTGRVNRIRSGETAPLPLQDGLQSPCSWCDHADACLYDSTLPGCKIQELDHKHRMEMPERKS